MEEYNYHEQVTGAEWLLATIIFVGQIVYFACATYALLSLNQLTVDLAFLADQVQIIMEDFPVSTSIVNVTTIFF